jgi:hypothetical protein
MVFPGLIPAQPRLAHGSGEHHARIIAACKRRQFATAFLSLLKGPGVKEELVTHDEAVFECHQ